MVGARIGVHEANDQPRGVEIPSHAHNDAVDGSVALDVEPVSPSPWRITTICAFGHHSFDARQQPVLREMEVGRLLDELKAGVQRFPQPPEAFATG